MVGATPIICLQVHLTLGAYNKRQSVRGRFDNAIQYMGIAHYIRSLFDLLCACKEAGGWSSACRHNRQNAARSGPNRKRVGTVGWKQSARCFCTHA